MHLFRIGTTSKKKDTATENAIADTDSEDGKSLDDILLLNPCRCCGSLVKLPESVTKFKCSICQSTITLIDPSSAPNNTTASSSSQSPIPTSAPVELQQLQVISYRSIRRKIKECEKQKHPNHHVTYKPLEDYLDQCFGSFEILNNSFTVRRTTHLSSSSPNINFAEVGDCYKLVMSLPTTRPFLKLLNSAIELLNRPGKSLTKPEDLKWLLILWELPTLRESLYYHKKSVSRLDTPAIRSLSYQIIKKVIGYLSNSDRSSLKYLSSWINHTSNQDYFSSKVELLNLYITFHLTRLLNKCQNSANTKPPYASSLRISSSPTSPVYSEYNESAKLNGTASTPSSSTRRSSYNNNSTVRSNSSSGANNSFHLPLTFQNGLMSSWSEPKPANKDDKPFEFKLKPLHYGNEWHIKTAARLLSVFFVANKRKLPVYSFYNSLVDSVNVKQDFEAWQSMFKSSRNGGINKLFFDLSGLTNNNKSSLTFCQFPFLLSLGAKISILEYEAKRTMERKAEEAFIRALDKKKAMDVHLRIDVRRTHISNDSLRCIKEQAGDLQKALKVHFVGEPGVDVGGLKKEWFSLLTAEIFSQENGMFEYNDESHLCWFAAMPLERNDELYYMVGVVLGLAMYNSTILDLRFPLALYKKLLGKKVDLDDYSELFPQTGLGLSKLLATKEDVSDYGLYFETTYKDLLGNPITKELVPNGSKIPVNLLNRHEYVGKWVNFYMNESIEAQFDSFHTGFHSVIGGNALSLFAPKEIEMIICGDNLSDSKLDVESFRSITKYNGWASPTDANESNIVSWFWEWFGQLSNSQHKKFLQFVTGSDRIPATGIHTMQFKITRMPYYGPHNAIRFPVAHTCFNELCLYEYRSKDELYHKLNWAINESRGFGIR